MICLPSIRTKIPLEGIETQVFARGQSAPDSRNIGEQGLVEGIGKSLFGLGGTEGQRDQVRLVAMSGHERACLVPEFVGRDAPQVAHEVEPVPDMNEPGFADQGTEDGPGRLPRIFPGRPRTSQRLDQRDFAGIAVDRLADALRERADRSDPPRDDLGQDLRRVHRGDVQVGDTADLAHHVVGAETFRVVGQQVLGRAKGDVTMAGEFERQHPQQGREFQLRPTDLLEPIEVEMAVGRERVHPRGGRRGLPAVGQLSRRGQVVEGLLVQADQRLDVGSVPEAPGRVRVAGDEPLGV
jgi:hypothetical protein